MQDEFKFYMQDAASKLLLVPVRGNKEAESAASSCNIPVASVSVSWTDGQFFFPVKPTVPYASAVYALPRLSRS